MYTHQLHISFGIAGSSTKGELKVKFVAKHFNIGY